MALSKTWPPQPISPLTYKSQRPPRPPSSPWMKLNVTNPKNFSQPGQSSRKVKEQGLDPDLQSKHVYLGGKTGVSDSEEAQRSVVACRSFSSLFLDYHQNTDICQGRESSTNRNNRTLGRWKVTCHLGLNVSLSCISYFFRSPKECYYKC